MSDEKYFVITFSEDGDIYITELNKERLLHNLDNDWYGNSLEQIDSFDGIDLGSFFGTVIIKGKIVRPIPKRIVESFDIE